MSTLRSKLLCSSAIPSEILHILGSRQRARDAVAGPWFFDDVVVTGPGSGIFSDSPFHLRIDFSAARTAAMLH